MLLDSIADYDGTYGGINYYKKKGLICGTEPLAPVLDGHTGKITLPASISTTLDTSSDWSIGFFCKIAANYYHPTEDMILLDTGNVVLKIEGDTGSTIISTAVDTDAAVDIRDGYTHFIAITYDQVDLICYIGETISTITEASLEIGLADIITSGFVIGKLDNLMVFDTVLSAENIAILAATTCNPTPFGVGGPPAELVFDGHIHSLGIKYVGDIPI